MKALVLDYGNVISELQNQGCWDRMSVLSGLPAGLFRTAFAERRADFDRGAVSGQDLYRGLLIRAGWAGSRADLDALALALLEEDMDSWSRVSGEVTAWARSIQEAGHPLGILSNMPFEFLERYGPRIELFARADAAVFSCREGFVKPEPAIFDVLIERLGLEPRDIVFFDDMDGNVEAARRAGITAFPWTGLEAAKCDWEKALE